MFVTEPLTLETAERVARRYFIAGFFCLPLVWALNVATFFRFRDKSETIAWYVKYSMGLCLLAMFLPVVWYAVLYTMHPDSTLWVIRPHGDGRQQGYFAEAVYSV